MQSTIYESLGYKTTRTQKLVQQVSKYIGVSTSHQQTKPPNFTNADNPPVYKWYTTPPVNRPTSYRRIHSRHQRRMSKTQKFFKCAHGKSAPYVHVASTNAPSHNRLTRPTRTAQQPINRPQYVGGAPRATKGTVRRGSPPRQPANTNINVSQRSRLWHKV
jgi:hypothetical protein